MLLKDVRNVTLYNPNEWSMVVHKRLNKGTVPGACRHDQKAVIGTEEPEAEPYLWAKHPSHFSLRLYTRFGPTGF